MFRMGKGVGKEGGRARKKVPGPVDSETSVMITNQLIY